MCGFIGIFNDQQLSRENFQLITDSLKHRGPDDSGNWIDFNQNIFFGHRRLSVLDTSSLASQPMESLSKRYVIIFNGEIYNHLEIRKEIETHTDKQFNWRSTSDTETLIEAISLFGIEQALSKVTGMFSFVVYDKKTNNMIIARDRFGEKPLYYGEFNNILFFVSDLTTLSHYTRLEKKIDEMSIYYLLQYNYIPRQLSVFKNIKKFPQSSYGIINLDDFKNKNLSAIKINEYWKAPSYNLNENSYDEFDYEKRIEEVLLKSVKSQMISDVPIGAFLSGGIDSSLIVSMLQSLSKERIKTFTIGFCEREFNEADKAKQISNHLKTDHTEVYFSSNDALELIPSLPKIFSEPFADPSMLPTILLCKVARENVTVALSGDGGDEIFGGYNRYKHLSKIKSYEEYAPSILKKFILKSYKLIPDNIWDSIGTSLNIDQGSDKIRKIIKIVQARDKIEGFKSILMNTDYSNKLLSNIPEKDYIHSDIDDISKINDINQLMMNIDQKNYLSDDILVKLDRSAMASSLETRVPFLDRDVVEFASKIPLSSKASFNSNKLILRKILKNYIPQKIIRNHKSGFNAPIDSWLRGPLKEWSADLIHSSDFKNSEYFNYNEVLSLWHAHLSGRKNYYRPLWSILIFQSWLNYNNI